MNAPPQPLAAYASIFRPGLFAGQTVWVTGAGSGIGRCTAHELAALGARVVISGRKAEKLERVEEGVNFCGRDRFEHDAEQAG